MGRKALEPYVFYTDHCCYSTGEMSLGDSCNPCPCIAVGMQSPSTAQEGEGMNVSGPSPLLPIFPKITAQRSSLAGKPFLSSSPLSTYMLARVSVMGAENKSGAISEYSIPDCVKSSFCDFLM